MGFRSSVTWVVGLIYSLSPFRSYIRPDQGVVTSHGGALPDTRTRKISFFLLLSWCALSFSAGGATAYGLGSLSKTLCWTWIFRIFGVLGFVMLPIVMIVLRNPNRRSDDVVPQSKADDVYTLKVGCGYSYMWRL